MASNLDKVDTYVNGPDDYEEIPELTDEDFARGTLMLNGRPLRRGPGRSAGDGSGNEVSLDPTIVNAFRATGPGWQARINDILREWLARQAA